MQTSRFENEHQPVSSVSAAMDGTGNGQLSHLTKALPGCRPCGLSWDECEMDLLESENGQAIILSFRVVRMEWSRELKMQDKQVQCNLQELEVLRWIAEGKNKEAAERLRAYDIQYLPQRRYCCLFPHQANTAHGVLEIESGMNETELKEVGEEAIRDSIVLLCPAPASPCEKRSHQGVDKEVHQLAAYWPMRQILCSTAIKDMVDISPVAVCHKGPEDKPCIVLDTDKAGAAYAPIDIRANMTMNSLYDSVGYILDKGRNNPQLALHKSWDGGTSSVTQEAVLHCQHRRAATQPTRLYDAHEGKIKCGISPQHYLALSYCWDEWPEHEDDGLKAKLKQLSQRLGVRYFWVDRWCINQDDLDEKSREIPCMHDYYMGASGCVVLTGQSVAPFQCVPQQHGAILSAYQQILLNAEALRSLFSCQWSRRVWTLQEVLLSRQVVYAVQDQLIDGDFVSEIVSFIETFAEYYKDDGEDIEWIGGYGSYRWNARAATVVYSRQLRMTTDFTGSQCLAIIRTMFGSEQQYEELHSADKISMPFEQAMNMVMGRHATKKEDSLYGVLGMCEGGSKIKVEYDVSWPTMLGKLQRAGMITECQLASPTINKLPGMSWLPEIGLGSDYGPFRNMERVSAFVLRPKLSWSEQGATVLGAKFEWQDFECAETDVLNVHGMGCWVVRGTIRFPSTPGLVAEVGGTSSLQFGTDRMGGTHIMLCQDVDEKTWDTVAIKVAGGVESGHVYREDGYVLELHRWLEGDPRLLKGRQWLIGSAPPVSLV